MIPVLRRDRNREFVQAHDVKAVVGLVESR